MNLQAIRTLFSYYRDLARTSIDRLDGEQLMQQPGPDDNSVAIIATHMAGNLLSRFTNFLTEDGEKSWRERDTEFEVRNWSKQELIDYWEKGWKCLFSALDDLTDEDSDRIILIRKEELTVEQALLRQLGHHSYHAGQIVYLAKWILQDKWTSLSIPKGGSDKFNQQDGSKSAFTR